MSANRAELGDIRNKIKRGLVYQERKTEKKKEKREARKKRKLEDDEAESAGLPRPKREKLTQDNMREFDETMVKPDDQEVLQDQATDELAPTGRTPKVLITTSPKPVGDTFKFCDMLLSIIPNSEFYPRRRFGIKEIVQYCTNQEFTAILIVHEEKKVPDSLILINLPDGPTAFFKLTSIRAAKNIENHARASDHLPEVIVNNFNTRLGHNVGRLLASLFPVQPHFVGRQVVTWHNQRDFIFFRRHRYIFKENGTRAGLQEIGPQFCLKLQWLQKGTFDTQFGSYEWHHKTEMDTSRRRFFL